MSKHIRTITRIAESEGLSVLDVTQNGHLHFKAAAKDGRTKRVTISVSPSDHRVITNIRKTFRQFAKNVGPLASA